MALAAVTLVSWIVNIRQLTECDFEFDSAVAAKCEVIHIIGLIPPASLVTVWLDDE